MKRIERINHLFRQASRLTPVSLNTRCFTNAHALIPSAAKELSSGAHNLGKHYIPRGFGPRVWLAMNYSKIVNSNTSIAESELTYEQLCEIIEAQDVRLFDVREPSELAEQGRISGSVNIPLGEMSEAFSLTPREFESRYGVKQPSEQDESIVLYCQGGRRSQKALHILRQLGYKSARHYPGGFLEWKEKDETATAV